MKRSNLWGWIIYIAMLVIAVVVGLVVVRPYFNREILAPVPMNGIVFILLAVLLGVIGNALLVELGHLLGAKAGGYKVLSWNCLGFTFKRDTNDKFRFCFSNFDGLTGETKVGPKDIKKSNPSLMGYFSLLLFLLEVIGLVIVIVLGGMAEANDPANPIIWWKVFAIVVLTVGGMIYLYDIFPAPLDSKNDGYVLVIASNKTNRVAYNQMLKAEYDAALGLPVEELPIYEDVTDFTERVNQVSVYRHLAKHEYVEALSIVEKTIACKGKVSDTTYRSAVAQKCSLLLLNGQFEEGREYYVSIPLDCKKFIASMENAPANRAYILISGLIESSIQETTQALDHADTAIRNADKDKQDIEEDLIRIALQMVIKAHPDWDMSAYNSGEEDSSASTDNDTKQASNENKNEASNDDTEQNN